MPLILPEKDYNRWLRRGDPDRPPKLCDTNCNVARRFDVAEQPMKHPFSGIYDMTGVPARVGLSLLGG
jgi:hypothetical protein